MTLEQAPQTPSGASAVVPESVVARLRSHGRAIVLPCLVLVAIAGAVGYFAGTFPEEWQNWTLLGAAFLAAVLLFALPVTAWLGRNYTITTRRIVLRGGLAVRTRQELLHSRGYDVTVRTSAIQAMFGSGDVLINTGLDHPVVLRDVPSAKLVQSTLHDLMEHSLTTMSSRRQQEQSRAHDETTYLGER